MARLSRVCVVGQVSRLSLADALIAASARQHGAILVHRDPQYGEHPNVARQPTDVAAEAVTRQRRKDIPDHNSRVTVQFEKGELVSEAQAARK